MLIALTAFLILHFGFGSSSMLLPFDQIEKAVKQSVTDEAHKKEALKIVDQMKAVEKTHVEKYKKSMASLDRALGQRNAPAGAIEKAAAPLLAESKATRAELLWLRFELRSVLSASEWAAVFPPPTSRPTSPKKHP